MSNNCLFISFFIITSIIVDISNIKIAKKRGKELSFLSFKISDDLLFIIDSISNSVFLLLKSYIRLIPNLFHYSCKILSDYSQGCNMFLFKLKSCA